MGCSDPKKKKTCNDNCTDTNKECKTVGKDCKCIPKETSKSNKKYKIIYQKYLDDNKNKYINTGGASIVDLSEWTNQQKDGPVAYYPTIVEKYGEPDIIINKAGGVCIWYIKNKDEDPHEEILLRDEYVAHSKPKNHHDFLYSYVIIHIPSEVLCQILSTSGSVNYDPLKRTLFARCGSFNANFATIRTVFEKMNDIDTDYNTNIVNALGKNKETELISNESYVKREVAKNQKMYSKELKKDFYSF
jgi:hypothetical protein